MRSKIIFSSSLIAILFFSLFTSCSTTSLVESWRDPGLEKGGIKTILVLAVLEDDVQRRLYEDTLVDHISKNDVVGIAGYTLMPNPEDYDEIEEVRIAVEKTGADSALIAKLISVNEESEFVPPAVRYQSSGGYYNGFYTYYDRSYQDMYGYTVTNTIVTLETTVFSTSTEELIWAGTTESFNPSSAKTVINNNISLIVKTMKKDGLL